MQQNQLSGIAPLKIYLIRHCESLYNQIRGIYLQKGKTKEEIEKEIQFDENFIDSELSDEGKNQSILKSKELQNCKIGTIFVSPYLRALQTCQLMFQSHPDQPEIVVHPFFGEKIGWACDLSKFNGKVFAGFEKFNWSLMEQDANISNYWMFKQNQNLKEIQEIITKSTNIQELLSKCCVLMKENQQFLQIIETENQFQQRILNSRQFLQNSIYKFKEPFYIVSHFTYLLNFTKLLSSKEQLNEVFRFANGECKEFILN